MILVVSAEFPASFSLHYKFIMHNYVQFGTIFQSLLRRGLQFGAEGKNKIPLMSKGNSCLRSKVVVHLEEGEVEALSSTKNVGIRGYWMSTVLII